jgi:flagellar protein FlbD
LISVHKLNGAEIMVNADLIEALDVGAETVIHLATGNKIIVRESADEIASKVIQYKRQIHGEGKVVNPIKSFERHND